MTAIPQGAVPWGAKSRRRSVIGRAVLTLVFAITLLISVQSALGDDPKAPTSPVSYDKQIKVLVTQQCAGCHQPSVKQGDLILTSYDTLMAGGTKGKVVIPGQPEASLLIQYLTGSQKPQMPFGQSPLSAEQIDLFRRWIREGAKDDTPAEARGITVPGQPMEYHAAPVVTALAYSPDGSLLAVSGYREILLHKGDGSALIARLPGISEKITSLAFSPDGKILAAVGGSPAKLGEVELWDVADRKLLKSIPMTTDTLFGASFSPDGAKLSFGGTDNEIHVIDVATGKELLGVKQHDGWVFGTTFSMDGSQLISVGRDGACKLTNLQGGVFIENINQIKGELVAIQREPKHDNVLVGGEEGVARLYMIHRPKALIIGDTTTLIREYEKQDGAVVAVAFSPDGSEIAVGGSTNVVQVYKTDSGDHVATFEGHKGGIYTLSFAPDGEHLAASGFDGTVRIYDLKSGQLSRAFIPVPIQKESATAAGQGGL